MNENKVYKIIIYIKLVFLLIIVIGFFLNFHSLELIKIKYIFMSFIIIICFELYMQYYLLQKVNLGG
jgi:hypothetical protein